MIIREQRAEHGKNTTKLKESMKIQLQIVLPHMTYVSLVV
jgi:hypothetical protein